MAAVPDEQLARDLVVRAFGVEATKIHRFSNGMMHYVFEAEFATRPSVVIRIAADYGHLAMRGASRLSHVLRPRGVPLPSILAENLAPPFPHIILERLPGFDLGEVIEGLSEPSLETIAAAVVTAQRIVAGSYPPGQRYGFAVSPEEAPHESWPGVLAAHLERSRGRIAAAGLFEIADLDALDSILVAMMPELAAFPPTPFLHDTTTKNVIVTAEGKFSGIVDVDDLCFGDPRYVVALTYVALITGGHSASYADAWMRLAGFDDDRVFRLYQAIFLADFMAERGQRFNGNEAPLEREHDARLRGMYLTTLTRLR